MKQVYPFTIVQKVESFLSISLDLPKKGLGFVDVSYTFTVKTRDIIPKGGTIELDFPTAYNLLSSDP